jgi:hemerythrin-like domain-containing protein
MLRKARTVGHAPATHSTFREEEITPMNAITMLTQDHREVEKLLDELEPTTGRGVKTRHELFGRIKAALTVHEAIEEEIFYPALREHPKAKDIVLEGYEEHNVVDAIMGELERMPVDAETWGAKAKVMIENLRHHIEEEEGEMFPTARKVFDADELVALGERMAARRVSAERELAAAR